MCSDVTARKRGLPGAEAAVTQWVRSQLEGRTCRGDGGLGWGTAGLGSAPIRAHTWRPASYPLGQEAWGQCPEPPRDSRVSQPLPAPCSLLEGSPAAPCLFSAGRIVSTGCSPWAASDPHSRSSCTLPARTPRSPFVGTGHRTDRSRDHLFSSWATSRPLIRPRWAGPYRLTRVLIGWAHPTLSRVPASHWLQRRAL